MCHYPGRCRKNGVLGRKTVLLQKKWIPGVAWSTPFLGGFLQKNSGLPRQLVDGGVSCVMGGEGWCEWKTTAYPGPPPSLESHSANSQGVVGQGLHSPFLISHPWCYQNKTSTKNHEFHIGLLLIQPLPGITQCELSGVTGQRFSIPYLIPMANQQRH